MKSDLIEIQLKSLPQVSGVYQYFDKSDRVIYVGKAKNLKKRVGSYFNKVHDNKKTTVLVKNIVRIEHIVVETEMDALLLENNLIKKYQPRYNVLLKDDKTYPWICIKKEPFPRVFYTRRVIKDGSEYFGPYTNMKTVMTLLGLVRSLYPLRSCKFDLSEDKVNAGKYKVCLEYHMGNCLAPCTKQIEAEAYENNIKAIREIIKGNFKESIQGFKKQMDSYAAAMEFEKAQTVKEKIESLTNYQAKSTIVNSKINNVDVFSIVSDESYGYINYIQVSHGAIIRSHTLEIKKKLDETDATLLQLGIVEIRQLFFSSAKEIFLSEAVALGEKLKVSVPLQGDKRKLVDLSIRNAKFFRMERFKQMKIVDPERHSSRIMSQMKTDLRLPKDPYHIECFDNSNIQGSNPVAACVVFKNGKPNKKEYRHYNIKTVEGPDDFASMEEVVYRRYKRLLEEEASLPQLIVIDGGKGQLSSAVKSLDLLGLRGKISIVGIAKRLEEIYFPGDSIPLYLDKRSESLKILQRARDEAHRFGITFHRQKRSKGSLNSKLDQIEGIGPATRDKLLAHFKSLKRIKDASKEAIESVLGKQKGSKIYAALHSN
ncbi:MAG: excinuclease ABC subunit UvrC [Flavobacteriaceae bacterium]|nr:excinuclease ABC subunit UvrC [Flavobacteriaceae bacterium]MDG2504351.1 excinuclease ABC subunit UvrC [Flavobacteriaceae bacterium]